jgi:hypothetical protein
MFTISQVELLGDAPILEDRKKFDDVCRIIEEYALEHEMIFGGSIAAGSLTPGHRARTPDDYVYEFFCAKAFDRANELTNLLAEKQEKLVMLKSVVVNKKFVIVIDNRQMVTIIHAPDPKLLSDRKADVFGKKQLVLSPEVQLGDIYRTLYSPNDAGDWEQSLRMEKTMFKGLKLERPQKDFHRDPSPKHIMAEKITLSCATNNPKIVLVGEHAASILMGGIKITDHVVELISADATATAHDIVEALNGENIPAKYVFNQSGTVLDPRLMRYTVKYGENDKDVCYIYNAGEYSLIPFTKKFDKSNTLYLGNLFVILRFMLIGLFNLRKIVAMGKIDPGFYERRVSSMMIRIHKLRSLVAGSDIKTLSEGTITDSGLVVFQESSSSYIGTYISDTLAYKMSSTKKKIPDYFPLYYLVRYGGYRKLE